MDKAAGAGSGRLDLAVILTQSSVATSRKSCNLPHNRPCICWGMHNESRHILSSF